MKIINFDNIEPKSISNIVFDWGGVITNINFKLTIKAFSDLGVYSFEGIFDHGNQDQLLENFEKGLINPSEFYDEIRNSVGVNLTNDMIKNAWCKMLLDTPIERLDSIRKLAKKFDIFLLSNTNKIHTDFYTDHLNKLYNIDYRSMFRKVYYSFEIGLKKPEIEIFNLILSDSRLDPIKTLFIDDTESNIDAASSLGILSLHLTNGMTIEKLFQRWIG